MKDDGKYNILQTVFVVMCANGLFARSHAIDAEHARHAATFRLAVSLIGFAGLLWVQWARRKAATISPDAAPALSPDAAVPHVSVTYNSTLRDRGRCMTYSLFGRWQMLLAACVVPVVLTLRTAVPLLSLRPVVGIIALLFLWGIYFGLMVAVLWLQAAIASPRTNGQRICQSVLRADGYFVVMPERTLFFRWADVKELREHNGDLYFWRGFGEGSFVPVAAFGGDKRAAREFFRVAQEARAGRDVSWPEHAPAAVPHDPTIWPPPPQRF